MALAGTVAPIAYSVEQAAAAIGISRRSAFRRIASGDVRTVKLGGRRLVPAAELERLCRLHKHDRATAPGDAVASATDGLPSPAALVELATSPADADVIAPPQPSGSAVRADVPRAASPAPPVARPRLSDLLAQTRDATSR